MAEPWPRPNCPPDKPVALTLPYAVARRVLTIIVKAAYRANARADQAAVEDLTVASDALGNALSAPAHRRFQLPERLYHAVIAGDEREYQRWCRVPPAALNPIYLPTVEAAYGLRYSGYTTYGTWYRRDDAQELLTAVKRRIIKR